MADYPRFSQRHAVKKWRLVRWVHPLWEHHPALFLLMAAAIMLLPVFLHPSIPMPRKVYSVVFVVDITQSMNVRDAGAAGRSRLEFSRAAVRDALSSLPCGSNASIGLFTERDVLMLFKPLEVCAHFAVLDEAAENLDWRMAWAADSFIAHGVFRGIEEAKRIGASTLVFFTDGHQAPPANPKYMPEFDGKPGEIGGLVVGVGDVIPQEIPHLDEHDTITGYWTEDEVMQFATFGMADVMSVLEMEGYHGRNAPHGADPGHGNHENLSALNEDGLQKLAKVTGLTYMHLEQTKKLPPALKQSAVERKWVATDIRPVFGMASLLLFIASFFMVERPSLFREIFNAHRLVRNVFPNQRFSVFHFIQVILSKYKKGTS
ncbi:vWA domain-containing protein [Methylovorus sp. MM2]|uniref:vWA domain-containing protein n=1 Tax=Methylovorus sp. MM2 TaxID=1848038 RepID=UPI0020B8BEF9|nr:vWA domain-containing protein [Methylovorus sp. MM2]